MKLFEPAFPKPVLIDQAIYHDHQDNWLNENPLIQAIPVKDTNRIEKEVRFIPELPNNLNNLLGVYQKTTLKRLSCINVVHPWVGTLYEDILSSILFGYIDRDPRRPEIRRFQKRVNGVMQ